MIAEAIGEALNQIVIAADDIVIKLDTTDVWIDRVPDSAKQM